MELTLVTETQPRHIFRVYNLPLEANGGDSFQALVENLYSVKNIWIAKDKNGVCQGWGWIECHTEESKTAIKLHLNGMKWRNQTLFTLE